MFLSHSAVLLPVHVVLQFHLYWTIPRGLILVVVFILRYLCNRGENSAMKMVRYFFAADRSVKFLVGNVGAPVSFFHPRNVNAIQFMHGTVYILRNAYEIVLCAGCIAMQRGNCC